MLQWLSKRFVYASRFGGRRERWRAAHNVVMEDTVGVFGIGEGVVGYQGYVSCVFGRLHKKVGIRRVMAS
jgi:hypothetical protein